jgi:hypothetical protein
VAELVETHRALSSGRSLSDALAARALVIQGQT